MSKEKIQSLLAELREAIDEAPDAEARQLIEELDADIHEMLEHDFKGHDSGSILERVNELETRFAADHPTLERFLRQIADWLAKMGV
jgi:Domain of unknown function (DUF4404)